MKVNCLWLTYDWHIIRIYTHPIFEPHHWLLTATCTLTRCIATWPCNVPRLEESEVKPILNISISYVKSRKRICLLSSSLLNFLGHSVIHRLCSKRLKLTEKCWFNPIIPPWRGSKFRMSLVAMLDPGTLERSMPCPWFFVLGVFLEKLCIDLRYFLEVFSRKLNL